MRPSFFKGTHFSRAQLAEGKPVSTSSDDKEDEVDGEDVEGDDNDKDDDEDDGDDDDDEAVQEGQLTETMPQFLELVVDSSSGQNHCTVLYPCFAFLFPVIVTHFCLV